MKYKPILAQQYFMKNSILILVCAALLGCASDDFSDLDQKIAEIKARPKGKIAPLPPVKPTEPFSFDLDGSRDPFKTLEKEAEDDGSSESDDNGVKPDPSRVKEDLENYALDSLKMVGTLKLKNDTTLWGLVKSSSNDGKSGTVYRVKVGNYMGLSDGKIIEISNDEIKLMEIVPDKNADKEKPRWTEQPNSLKLVITETK